MTDFENKVLYFNTALKDVYKDDEDRELSAMPKMEFNEETLTDDFTAILFAMMIFYAEVTGDDCDVVDFTHLLNKLAIQHLMKEKGVEL